MIDLGVLVLLRPWWLLALVPIGVFLWHGRGGGGLGAWTKAVDPVLLAALAARGQVVAGQREQRALPAAVAALTAVALAGPALQRSSVGVFSNLDGVVLVLDASRSVAMGGSLVTARLAGSAVAHAAEPRQTALIVYAGDAYIASPFTTDEQILDPILAAVDGDTVPDVGTRPARGLRLARRLFESAGMIEGDVVLISDGGRINDPTLNEARLLAEAGYRVHTLFIPATEALPRAAPAPDRPALDRLAKAGGGIAAAVDAPEALLQALRETPTKRLAASPFSSLAWADLGRLILVLALPGALFLFRRSA